MTRQPAKLAVGAGLEAWWNLIWQVADPGTFKPLRVVIQNDDAQVVVAEDGPAGLTPPKVNDPALIGLPADARDGDHQIRVGGCCHVVVVW